MLSLQAFVILRNPLQILQPFTHGIVRVEESLHSSYQLVYLFPITLSFHINNQPFLKTSQKGLDVSYYNAKYDIIFKVCNTV